jgi:hypothetical protein
MASSAEAVGLAIAARVNVGQGGKRQFADRRFADAVRVGHIVIDIKRCGVGDMERALVNAQAQIAGVGDRAGLDRRQHRLADLQLLANHQLAGGLGGVDVENKIGAGAKKFVMKVNRKLDANHVFPKLMRPARRVTPGRVKTPDKTVLCDGNVEFSVLAVRGATAQPGRKAFTRAKRLICGLAAQLCHITRHYPKRQGKSREIRPRVEWRRGVARAGLGRLLAFFSNLLETNPIDPR